MELHSKTEMVGQASGINISGNYNEIVIPIPINEGELMHRTPEMLHQLKQEKYFEPRVVSLGPYHRKTKDFPVTEDNKCKIKNYLIHDKKVEDFEEMRIALKDAKDLYMVDPISSHIISDDFNDMMILDACFIIHVIDHIARKSWSVPGIRPHHLPLVVEDMFLLENQVPFGVLEAVMKLLGRNPQEMITKFVDTINRDLDVPAPISYWQRLKNITVYQYFHWTIKIPVVIVFIVVMVFFILVTKPREIRHIYHIEHNRKELKKRREHFMRDEKPLHLLQILRADLLFYSEEKVSKPRAYLLRPSRCATELKAAGINFQRTDTNSLEDVKFKKGIIFGHICLPSITHLTKGRLLNLIAYELCSERCGYGITSYVCLLDGLIDRPEDVKELRSKNILPKGLGNDEDVANFFNMVGTDLSLHPSSYYEVLTNIETHCQSKWRADMADIHNKYFSSRLTTISFIMATLLLLVTIAQAYVAFFPVKN